MFVGAAKSPGLVPLNMIVPIVKMIERLSVNLTLVAEIVVPTFSEANVKDARVRPSTARSPSPSARLLGGYSLCCRSRSGWRFLRPERLEYRSG